MFIIKVKARLTNDMLGTVPKDPDIYEKFIASKAAEATIAQISEELETVPLPTDDTRGWTGFHERDKKPFIYSYMLKGFFKEAMGMMKKVPGSACSKISAHKKFVDGLLFIQEREIYFFHPNGSPVLSSELIAVSRSLRAQTPQGERITIVKSDQIPEGSSFSFTIKILGGLTRKIMNELFDYAELRALGQWRNAGYGTFTVDAIEYIGDDPDETEGEQTEKKKRGRKPKTTQSAEEVVD